MTRRPTQREKILEMLRFRSGQWVPAYDLAALALQYCARIAELRAEGHKIDNQTEYVNGQTRSYYRLVPPQGQQALFPGAGVGG